MGLPLFDFAIRDWADVAAIVTVLGVPTGLFGLYLAYRQLRLQAALEAKQGEIQTASYEDAFVREYRQIVQRIPTQALLGDILSPAERRQVLSEFYHYIDLCNEQTYQNSKGRIRPETWIEWESGIRGNLGREEFALAWSYIASKSQGEFHDLRTMIEPRPYDPTKGYPPSRL